MSLGRPLLEVRDLCTWFGERSAPLRAVDGVSFTVPAGATAALVGESGCGKSVTALSLARLVPCPPGFHPRGEVWLDGEDVMRMPVRRLIDLRGRKIAYVFQEPGTALNPALNIGSQIMEAVRLHRRDVDARAEALTLMEMVGLPDPAARLRAFPHELSGGMQQRAVIAMALACRPRLLVADEPTTALDVTIQAQIVDLLLLLRRELGMAVLLISHNLGLVAGAAGLVNVMYCGRIVEAGRTADVLARPAHPYTKGLLDAARSLEGAAGPDNGDGDGGGPPRPVRMKGIDGAVPDLRRLPAGCKFSPRCPRCRPVCRDGEPAVSDVDGGHSVRCHYPLGAETAGH